MLNSPPQTTKARSETETTARSNHVTKKKERNAWQIYSRENLSLN